MISMIYACDENGGIGYRNKLPWPYIKEDMIHFMNTTKDKIVVMGSNTWFSLPGAPLKNRINVVLSSKAIDGPDHVLNKSPAEVIEYLQKLYDKEIVIIGGKFLYNVYKDIVDVIYLTEISGKYPADTYMNNFNILEKFEMVEEQEYNNIEIPIKTQKWVRHEKFN